MKKISPPTSLRDKFDLSELMLSSGVVESANRNLLFDIVDDSFLAWPTYPVAIVIFAKLGQRGEGSQLYS